jgi:hypothetical protein
MQTLIIFVALSSILLFEGGRRLIASLQDRSGYFLASMGVAALIAAAWLHISEDMAYRLMAPPDEGQRFAAGPPWSNPKEALPGLPINEQAEKTRILAVSYYTSTGRLIEHLSSEGAPIRLTPTQEEMKVREDWLALRVSSNAHLSHTYEKPLHLLSVVVVAALALVAFRKKHAKSAV